MRGRFGFIVGWVPSDGVWVRRRKNRRGRTIKGLLDGSQNRYFDESVLEPGSAGAADRLGGHVDSAPRARIHVITGSARWAEASGADRACTDIRRNAGPALRTRKRHGRHRGESHAAHALGGLLRDETAAGGALIQPDGELFLPRTSADGGRPFVDVAEIFHDLEERALRRRGCLPRRRRCARPRFAVASIDAARAPGERGAAVLASIEFERRQLAALPTEDPRHRPEIRDDFVEVSRRVRVLARALLQHRWTTSLRSPAHRGVLPSPIRQDLQAVIIRTGSVRTPREEDLGREWFK